MDRRGRAKDTSRLSRLRRILSLLVWPGSLARAAEVTGLSGSCLVASCAISIVLPLMTESGGVWSDAGVVGYLSGHFVRAGATAAALFPLVLLGAALVYFHVRSERWSRAEMVRVCALLLSTAVLVLPAFVWATCAALAGAQTGYVPLSAVKPTWMSSPVLILLGSRWCWWVGVGLVVTANLIAWRRLASLRDPEVCGACGYSMAGLGDYAPCPECGSERERKDEDR